MLLRRYKQGAEPAPSISFAELTVKQLKELISEKGIEFDPKAKKEDLIKLLEGAE